VARVRLGFRVPAWVAAALAVAVLAVACGTEPSPLPVPVSWNQVLNASVPGDAVGQEHVTLSAGQYSVLTGDEASAVDVRLHDLHVAGDLDGNRVQDEVGIVISTAGGQLRTESIVGFLAAAGGPTATAAYPLPAGYRVEGLTIDADGVVVTYTAPRVQDDTYDEVKGRLVLRLEDNRVVEVDRSEEPVPMAPPEPLGLKAGKSTDRSGEIGYGWRAQYAQTLEVDDRLEIRLTSAWGAANLGVFAPDGSILLAPESGSTSFVVEKAVAGDYVIHLVGGAATPVPYSMNVLRTAAPVAPPSGSSGLPAVPDPGEKVVYLTFDDGPDGRYTPQILESLRKYDARATFFVVGSNLQRNRRIAEQIVEQGSTIANHTWNHASLQGVSQAEFRSAVGRTQELMGSLGTKCLRPPYGAVDANTETYAREMGLTVWKWSIDTIDYRKPTPDTIAERATATAGPGSVILMHDGGGDRTNTVAAVPKILERLKAKGLRAEALCR
jgi:peptidoglycan-N-acetylglucosamine deacetylase